MLENNLQFKKLLSLNLPSDDYAVFGSGPLFAHGIVDFIHDLDIVSRKEAWKRACELGEPQQARIGDSQVVVMFNGEVEIFNGWAPGKWDVNKLINSADVIEGIRFVKLEDVVKWKEMRGREKDIKHIQLIKEYLSSR